MLLAEWYLTLEQKVQPHMDTNQFSPHGKAVITDFRDGKQMMMKGIHYTVKTEIVGKNFITLNPESF